MPYASACCLTPGALRSIARPHLTGAPGLVRAGMIGRFRGVMPGPGRIALRRAAFRRFRLSLIAV